MLAPKIKQKTRFAFSQSSLHESMNTLKDLVSCLRTLISQTETSEQCRPLSQPSTEARKVIEQFALVQTASRSLYDALRSACTKHTQHQANFSLQPIPSANAHHVRFSVGFRQVLAPTSGPRKTVWFTAESRVKRQVNICSSSQDAQTLSALSQAVKRGRASPSPPPERQTSKLRKKSKQCQLSPAQPILALSTICEAIETPSDPPLSNLCSHSNFCNQLQNFLSRSVTQPEFCIGYLEQSSGSKHLIYLKGQDGKAEDRYNLPPSSLAELLSHHQEGSGEAVGIPQSDRLSLSRKLATAVLQFYSTPWLRSSWSSNDVLFQLQSNGDPGQIHGLKEPFVDVSVRGSTIDTSIDQSSTCYPFAPNDFLFGLGVMLLELAYQRPLQSLQQPCDAANSHDDRHTLFFTAKRVSRLVSTKSGSRYGEIVRKCLSCDFGRGDDLSQPALQEGVYREVICELKELEDLLRAMDLGP